MDAPGNLPKHSPDQKEQDPRSDDQGLTTPLQPAVEAADNSASIGRFMFIGFWILLLGMLYLGADRWYERAANLNSSVSTEYQNGRALVELQANRYGHYIATGSINNSPVVFLVDTGATSISIPQTVADRLQLQRGRPRQVTTANGLATVFEVSLSSVGLGDLKLGQVQAHINPHLPGTEILLGMSYLRHFELRQRGETLTILQP